MRPRRLRRDAMQRRRTILTLLEAGLRPAEVASRLQVDPSTVRRHVRWLKSQRTPCVA